MSERFHHILDPDGDMRLTLISPNEVFAPWPRKPSFKHHEAERSQDDGQAELMTDGATSEFSLPEDSACEDERNKTEIDGSDTSIAFRISSQHLRLASARFRRLRSSIWKDDVQSNGVKHITLDKWDEQALLVVLNIIHHHNRLIPHTVSLDMLAKIAVIVDYFEFHESVEPFSRIWVKNLSQDRPETYSRDLDLRIWISYVFGDENIDRLKSVAVVHAVGQFDHLGLPIPGTILDEIQRNIEDIKTYVIGELRQIRSNFEESRGSSSDCKYGVLGALWMEFRKYGVFGDAYVVTDDSVADIYRALRKASQTFYFGKKQRSDGPCCGLGGAVAALVEEMERRLGSEIKQTVVASWMAE